MTRVCEFSGSARVANQNGCVLNLYINGQGMFVIRAPFRLKNSRSNFYYTRYGQFSVKDDGRIIDQHGGVLQVTSVLGMTIDAKLDDITDLSFLNDSPDYSASASYFVVNPHGKFEFIVTGHQAESLRSSAYVGTIKLIPGLEEASPARLVFGTVLDNCWVGKKLSANSWIKPPIMIGKLENLLPHEEYDRSRIKSSTHDWCFSLLRNYKVNKLPTPVDQMPDSITVLLPEKCFRINP